MTNQTSEIRDGLRDGLPIVSAIAPYAAVFGAVAVESGLSVVETMLTSGSIYAVASQYVMVESYQDQLPVWAILLAFLAVNFRHVLYSAASTRWLTQFSGPQKALAFFVLHDAQFASAEARAAKMTVTPGWYFSYALLVYAGWMIANFVGAQFGRLIGDLSRYGLDMLLPLFFAAMVFSLRKKQRFASTLLVSLTAGLLAYFTVGSPWHITLGGLAGILTAAALSSPKTEEAQHA